jgi:hypothetical protein
MGEQFQSEAGMYGALSEFYVALWEHLDLLSERSRWLHASEILPLENRVSKLRQKLDYVVALPLEGSIRRSLHDQLEKTISLSRDFEQKDGRVDSFPSQVEDWKMTLQELSIEFARLEVVNAQDG